MLKIWHEELCIFIFFAATGGKVVSLLITFLGKVFHPPATFFLFISSTTFCQQLENFTGNPLKLHTLPPTTKCVKKMKHFQMRTPRWVGRSVGRWALPTRQDGHTFGFPILVHRTAFFKGLRVRIRQLRHKHVYCGQMNSLNCWTHPIWERNLGSSAGRFRLTELIVIVFFRIGKIAKMGPLRRRYWEKSVKGQFAGAAGQILSIFLQMKI